MKKTTWHIVRTDWKPGPEPFAFGRLGLEPELFGVIVPGERIKATRANYIVAADGSLRRTDKVRRKDKQTR